MIDLQQLGRFTGDHVFYDWEFEDTGTLILPISVGMVDLAGSEYYAVNAQADMVSMAQHPFLSKHVLPHLPMDPENPEKLDTTHWSVKPLWQIRDEVRRFVLKHNDPNLWAWYSAYDHVATAQLFGPMAKLPQGFPKHTNDLKTICDYLGNPRVPEQPSGAHNALEDAKHARDIFLFLRDFDNGRDLSAEPVEQHCHTMLDANGRYMTLRFEDGECQQEGCN